MRRLSFCVFFFFNLNLKHLFLGKCTTLIAASNGILQRLYRKQNLCGRVTSFNQYIIYRCTVWFIEAHYFLFVVSYLITTSASG